MAEFVDDLRSVPIEKFHELEKKITDHEATIKRLLQKLKEEELKRHELLGSCEAYLEIIEKLADRI